MRCIANRLLALLLAAVPAGSRGQEAGLLRADGARAPVLVPGDEPALPAFPVPVRTREDGRPAWTITGWLDPPAAPPPTSGGPAYDPARDRLATSNAGSAVSPGGSCFGIVSLEDAFLRFQRPGEVPSAGLGARLPELEPLLAAARARGGIGLGELTRDDPEMLVLAQRAASRFQVAESGWLEEVEVTVDELGARLEEDGRAMLVFSLPVGTDVDLLSGEPVRERWGGHAVMVHGAPGRVRLEGEDGLARTGTFFPVEDPNLEPGRDPASRFGLVRLDDADDPGRAWTFVGRGEAGEETLADAYQGGAYLRAEALKAFPLAGVHQPSEIPGPGDVPDEALVFGSQGEPGEAE